MPVAASSQRDSQMSHLCQLFPKPPNCHPIGVDVNAIGQLPPGHTARHPNAGPFIAQEHNQTVNIGAAANVHSGAESPAHYFSTHSPPILNLSPNLSPAEPQRGSPIYDLRDTTRRRSLQGRIFLFHFQSSPRLKRHCLLLQEVALGQTFC
jgi:hypothetical protein